MACDNSFSSSHMLLCTEKVSLIDLIKLLFSSNLKKRKFVDSSEDTEKSFQYRWIIFISIVLQKVLQFLYKPLSWFGSLLEYTLNLLSSNDNVGMLLINILRWKVVIPEKASPNYYSMIGHLDKRMEMDNSVKPEDSRYYPLLSMMASKLSYENRACIEHVLRNVWKMDYLGFYDYWNEYQEKATTQVLMLRDKNVKHDTFVVTFRGTESFDADAWCSDFDISWYELPCFGRVHGGFMKALGLKKNKGWPKEAEQEQGCPPSAYYDIRDKLKGYLSENKDAKFIVTGHSLGGALAILFPAILALHGETWLLERLEGVYTFGQPRVGDGKFGKFMQMKFKEHNVKYLRFVYGNDIVPRLPYDNDTFLFKHFGMCLHYDRHYQGKIVVELPNKNYFSLRGSITMRVDAFFELLRSFTIAEKRGPDYREGNFLKIFRVLGLIIPGVPAHCPQDYINSTRLGSPKLLSMEF